MSEKFESMGEGWVWGWFAGYRESTVVFVVAHSLFLLVNNSLILFEVSIV